jgi:L-ascorbate metabolism protein UlaG (beta-lactamase superfamily)
MRELKEIDIAFLPVNQPYTMTVDQAVRAAKMFSPKVLYPYHFGETDVKPIKEQLKESGIDVRIRKME